MTDPPYNVDYSAKVNELHKQKGSKVIHKDIANDNMSRSDFYNFLRDVYLCLDQSLKDGGAFYIWYASLEISNFYNALNETRLVPKQNLIWQKNTATLGRQDYQWKHEPCIYGWKSGASHYFIDERTHTTIIQDEAEVDVNKMTKEQLKDTIKALFEKQQVQGDVLKEDKPLKSDLHPTMKPVKLIARLINNSSRKGEVVLDLFGGSGTTLIASEQLGRKCRMMELDPHYCDVIISRWEKLTGKTARKIE